MMWECRGLQLTGPGPRPQPRGEARGGHMLGPRVAPRRGRRPPPGGHQAGRPPPATPAGPATPHWPQRACSSHHRSSSGGAGVGRGNFCVVLFNSRLALHAYLYISARTPRLPPACPPPPADLIITEVISAGRSRAAARETPWASASSVISVIYFQPLYVSSRSSHVPLHSSRELF